MRSVATLRVDLRRIRHGPGEERWTSRGFELNHL